MKTCTKCKQTKQLTEFGKRSASHDGLQSRCKVCRKKIRQNNRKKENATARKWCQNNREKIRASDRKSSQRPEYKKRKNARHRERMKTDPLYRLAKNLRCRLLKALKGKSKSASTMSLLGCSQKHAKDHLATQFQPGMTWKNHGTWHVDHMMPCASFDLSDPEQQRRCFHYTNLQPVQLSGVRRT